MYTFADWNYLFLCAKYRRFILIIVDDEFKRGRLQKSLNTYKTKYDIGERVIRIRSMDRIFDVSFADYVICDVALLTKDILVCLRTLICCSKHNFYLTPRAARGISFS